MAEKKTSARKATSSADTFTEEERAAMREHAKAQRASARARAKGESEEPAVLEKLAEMDAADRALGERLHALIRANAPDLAPRLWYGMPAYAKDGSVLCFFQDAKKFKSRYATLGFSDKAMLDDGQMWPTSFALRELTAADEARIVALLKRAVG
ncbi:iron chaperone [Roseisolibacter agri]|uniref:YdhG-like domain-containing protein n=1 Tax=Roseisolibacter agri TaxID=2014610 RepID=A0AA37Q3W0_9BACT|nr:DUF1801 domain-containing protein [Roseisolibacter agri]GLC25899.1 hypothetical protein rosag_24120 [Roseisolibacter agri]